MPNKYAQIIENLGGSHSGKSTGQVIDEVYLSKVELKLGHKLPSDYRECFRLYKGVGFSCVSFDIFQDIRWEEASLDLFYDSGDEVTIADNYFS